MNGYYRELQVYGAEGWGWQGRLINKLLTTQKKVKTQKSFLIKTCWYFWQCVKLMPYKFTYVIHNKVGFILLCSILKSYSPLCKYHVLLTTAPELDLQKTFPIHVAYFMISVQLICYGSALWGSNVCFTQL